MPRPAAVSRVRAPRSPGSRLAESSLQDVLGYQLAQATIATQAVFEACARDDAAAGPPPDGAGAPREALRPVEYTVLALIVENPGGTPARLARALAVSNGNITAWVDRLVAKGLVRREPGTTDRRAQHLHATEAGSRRAAALTGRIVEAEHQRLEVLSAAERAMLVELLRKVAQCR